MFLSVVVSKSLDLRHLGMGQNWVPQSFTTYIIVYIYNAENKHSHLCFPGLNNFDPDPGLFNRLLQKLIIIFPN